MSFTFTLHTLAQKLGLQPKYRGWVEVPRSPDDSEGRVGEGILADEFRPGSHHGLRNRRPAPHTLAALLRRRNLACTILLFIIPASFALILLGNGVSYVLGGGIQFGSLGGFSKSDGSIIPLGQSRMRDEREVFWWEQFPKLVGYFNGRKTLVAIDDFVTEQQGGLSRSGTDAVGVVPDLVSVGNLTADEDVVCYIDEEKGIKPPRPMAYSGLPQGFPAPLFGSLFELSITPNCYDRINRFAPYGYGFADAEGGLGLPLEGDGGDIEKHQAIDFREVKWADAQRRCIEKTSHSNRTAFIIRTWHDFHYTPFHIMMLRAMVNELTLLSGGRYEVHFLIEVKDTSLKIWEDLTLHDKVLAESLPPEFEGMGSLWSVDQMKEIYPGPFAKSLANISGDDIYSVYRSLHFPLQYFASRHLEFAYFWQWEMDVRVTGSYLELLDKVSAWAEEQPREAIWERNAKFLIPSLYNETMDYNHSTWGKFRKSITDDLLRERKHGIQGIQLPVYQLLNPLPDFITTSISNKKDEPLTDFISFNPLFDPVESAWAFRDDITGYDDPWQPKWRPPRRASLITASRFSLRLLRTMHAETLTRYRTMFPEMFPASTCIGYGYKAVYPPVPVYMDHDWTGGTGPSEAGVASYPRHVAEIFNNEVIDGKGAFFGMKDNGEGHFHGKGGSVFGPGEHVFRGSTYYSNAEFASYLWRRWLGRENMQGELDAELDTGRMCLPMMLIHPVKND